MRRLPWIVAILGMIALAFVQACANGQDPPPLYVPAKVYLSKDPLVDNGKKITETVFNEAITAPGGLYSMLTTANLGGRDAVEFDFQGVMYLGRKARITAPGNSGVVLFYVGPTERATTLADGTIKTDLIPAIYSRCHGLVGQGVNLWRLFYPQPGQSWPATAGIGWQFEGSASTSASTTALRDGSIAGFKIGIHFKESTHIECFDVENYSSYRNDVFFQNDENQAVSHDFENIFLHGPFKTAFQFTDLPTNNGGGMNIGIRNVVSQWNGLILDIQKSNQNSQEITISNLKIDGGPEMKDWKLLRQRKGRPTVTITGLIGKDAPPSINAIDCEDPTNVNISMSYLGKIWPRDFEVKDGKWIIKAFPN